MPADEKPVIIETRFGPLEFGPENSLFMPVGPLGFGDFRRFGLAALPKPASSRFKLLQSLDNHELGFIVTTLDPNDGRVTRADIEDAALSVGIPMDAAQFLLIVTIRVANGSTNMTANLRAPIVLDRKRMIARQVVMANASYPIQMPL
ncbi:MAG: flagellar assembly protein FliW [Kiloniellales bacterium]